MEFEALIPTAEGCKMTSWKEVKRKLFDTQTFGK